MILDSTFRKIRLIFQFLVFQIFLRWRLKKCSNTSLIISPIHLDFPSKISIGKGSRILNNARLEVFKQQELGSISVGNNVMIGHNFFCTSSESVVIKDGVLISDNVAIIDNNHIHQSGLSSNNTGTTSSSIIVNENVTIYRNATILAGVTIGANSIVAANSVVTSNVPSNTLVAGAPAVIKKSL